MQEVMAIGIPTDIGMVIIATIPIMVVLMGTIVITDTTDTIGTMGYLYRKGFVSGRRIDTLMSLPDAFVDITMNKDIEGDVDMSTDGLPGSEILTARTIAEKVMTGKTVTIPTVQFSQFIFEADMERLEFVIKAEQRGLRMVLQRWDI